MKKNCKLFGIIAIAAVIGFTMIACNKSGGGSGSSGGGGSGSSGGGGKTLNSAEALKEYLDSQPVNGPDKPIKVSMAINDPMLEKVAEVIKSAGKYVSLNITGNLLTKIRFEGCETLVSITIPNSVTVIGRQAFYYCTSLTSITIPNSVTSIGDTAFINCFNLTSVSFESKITSDNFSWSFHGDLKDKYLAGGIGTYTTTAPVHHYDSVWTKQ